MLHPLVRDVRFAFRQFAGRPGFTLTVVLVLALGLGANTAIFGVVNTFLLRPLPYPQPDRLVSLFERSMGNGGSDGILDLSPGNFLDWQKQATSFERLAAYSLGPFNLSSETNAFEPERIQGCACSATLLATLKVMPYLGRTFLPDEDRFGGAKVAIVSYNLWQQRLGGSPDIIGKSIRLDGDSYQVVGVMPRGFLFPNDKVEIWSPLLSFLPPAQQVRHDLHYLAVIGRLRSGVTIARARAELDAIASRYKQEHPDVATGSGASVIPQQEFLVRGVHTALLILLGAVGCVLLIACVNVANLLLTRSSARAREISVRAAIGAGRGDIIRQLLTESALLALAGGAAGVAVARVLTPVLIAHAPGAPSIIAAGNFSMQPEVFLFAFGIALLTGIAVGLFPAVQSSRASLAAGLRESTRSATGGRSHARFRGILIAAEVALSLLLLVAAGLLIRSFARLWQVSPGIRTDHVLAMTFSLPNNYATNDSRSAFFTQLVQRLDTVPGVASAALASCPPISGGYCNALFFYREDRPFIQGKYMVANEMSVDPRYLATAGVPLLRGRNFTNLDGIGFDRKNPRPGSILINDSMARQFFPGEDPIGKRVFFDFTVQQNKLQGTPVPKYEIIGVVGDVRASLDRLPQATLYRPILDGDYNGATILLHTLVSPRSVANAALSEIHKLDASMAVYDVRTMEEILGNSVAGRRFTLLLFAAFAGLAVLLAAVGLYGVLSYSVAQRAGEIGIRMALGASHSRVRGFVVREGLKPAIAGIIIGFAGALFAARVLKTLLFGVEPLDPVTFALVPVLLLGIAALACYIPALRATRIDPIAALRSE